jgi:putative flippase GtrA
MVGLTCYLTGLAILLFLTEVAGVHYLASFAASFVLTNAMGFWLNGKFSFQSAATLDRGAVARYFAVSALSLAVNSAALRALVEWFHVWYLAAVVVLTAINLPVNFAAHRVVTYRAGRSHAGRGQS